MRNQILAVVLHLFLLVPASITWGQKVTVKGNVVHAEYEIPEGIITVYLPSDIRPGDQISGTIIATPNGRNERQKENNLEKLLSVKLEVLGQPVSPASDIQPFRIALAATQPGIPRNLRFIHPGSISTNVALPDQVFSPTLPQADRCVIPSHALTAAPVPIKGPFDGVAENTRCMVGSQSARVLAESPRLCIVEWPAQATGMNKCVLTEGTQSCEQNVSGVDMQVTTGKLNLRRGESTYIDVKVTGLEGLPDKATLTIVNMSPSVVTMTNGNTQVHTIWPPADSANGVYSVHCPANSISTGNFTVNIELDLPEAGTVYSTTNETVPPGYVRKNCSCSGSATISKQGNRFTVQASGSCEGAHGIGINTFERCRVAYITYQWNLQVSSGQAQIDGSSTQAGISVRSSANARYTACVVVTITCIDGTTCTATACADESGKPVTTPGTETRPPTRPENPPTTERPPTTTSSKCKCSCTVTIAADGRDGRMFSYKANAMTACTGTSGTGSSRILCAVAKVSYTWSIVGGAADASISGPANGGGVTIERSKVKPLVLRVVVNVTCNDGTTCECSAEIEIPGEEDKSCSPVLRERMEPAMDGGLVARFIGIANNSQLPRDEFIVLQADGADWDQLVFRCEPSKPDCPDEPSEKTIPLVGRVRFEWTIEGEGSFVQLGCLPDEKNAEGERVIFKPFYVPLPVKAADTTLTTTVLLKIIDDASAVADATVEKRITIRLKRSKSNPDKYQVEISGGTGRLPAAPAKRETLRTCRTIGPAWNPGDDLVEPVILKPAVADNDKMVLGQWLRLSASAQADNDRAVFRCVSQAECVAGSRERSYADRVDYTWEIVRGGGRFISGNSGQYVIYEAPTESRADVTEVIIRVTVKNAAGERMDPEKKKQELVITFYKPGIQLDYPPLAWLPTDTNSVEILSSLAYKDGDWKPGLAHMCRIHFVEMVQVSAEKGICMNDPTVRDAQDCRDLLFSDEENQEAFDDPRHPGKCNSRDQFIQARSRQPVREMRVKIHSRDFGAYSLVRSFANINKKTRVEGKPLYTSIPKEERDAPHPLGFRKKAVYADNRVSVPRDVDENRIADNGWLAFGGVRLGDIAANNGDEDDEPTGDGFRGDGLTNYEEYRGFRVRDGDESIHQRTNYQVKDIFIRNRNALDLGTYVRVSGLDVHELDSHHYVSDRVRVVNANANPQTHVVDQMGLLLIDAGNHSSLLGVAVSTTMNPAIPNQEREIRVYSQRIAETCRRRNMSDSTALKTAAVTAHELLHGNNVCHHGEGDPGLEKAADAVNGLRSGNVSCVMRYDNTGTAIRGHTPEAIGSALCTSAAGTGYNANNQLFGNAAAQRGNCRGQIRVSGRGQPPRPCGNR